MYFCPDSWSLTVAVSLRLTSIAVRTVRILGAIVLPLEQYVPFSPSGKDSHATVSELCLINNEITAALILSVYIHSPNSVFCVSSHLTSGAG